MWDEEITLIHYTDEVTDIADHYNGEAVEVTLLAQVESATRLEYYKHGTPENRPEYIVTVNIVEYDNQHYCRFKGKEYSITRTYVKDRDLIELTLSKKTGRRK